ncbi:MAG TPA: class I SAM-dependent methyltransferase [Bryobacteraceae bacterium]|nr:class I SAM-dependent methyltransferase [Bryobacteraceae bacterium]
MSLPIEEKMRADWNQRARSDAFYYVSTGRRQQDQDEFLSTGALHVAVVQAAMQRIRSEAPPGARRVLDIGCGPGRLMLPLSRVVGEIHGIDVSDEMISLARRMLRDVPHAFLYRGSGTDLAPLSSGYFDCVYSYAVFQHIPSAEIVTRYLEEAVRVLKPGGVLCCQLRGAPSPVASTAGHSDTWVGCVYPADEVGALSKRTGMCLLQIHGAATQHMWVVARKPLTSPPESFDLAGAILKAVTPSDNPYAIISPTGPGAAFLCWLEGLPEFTSLNDFQVSIGGVPAEPFYVSDHLGRGGFQLNVLVPPRLECGTMAVQLRWRGQLVPGEPKVEIRPYPELVPSIEAVTDGVDLLAGFATSTGSLQVTLSGVADPREVSISIDSHPVDLQEPQLLAPHRAMYCFALTAPGLFSPGVHSLTVATKKWSQTVEIQSHTPEV